jgi:hypothetical protein
MQDNNTNSHGFRGVRGHLEPLTTRTITAHYTPKFLQVAVEKYSATPAGLVAELEAEQLRAPACHSSAPAAHSANVVFAFDLHAQQPKSRT